MAQVNRSDVVIVGGGHNGLVAAILLARAGVSVTLFEEKDEVGGAAKTEYPFAKAPNLGISSGAYLLGLAPPELLAELGLDLPLIRRDPHYFLPTTGDRFLLFGSDRAAMQEQFLRFFSEADWRANAAMNDELGALRDDLATSWLLEPLPLEETAERFVRPALRRHFVDLCRGSAKDYLERFAFRSDLLKAMYAVTDAFSGLDGGYETLGSGFNLLVHNMCRLPSSGGTWMIVQGGMGTVTGKLQELARAAGVRIEKSAPVLRIEIRGQTAHGVALADGRTFAAEVVLSNADPFRTQHLVGKENLPEEYLARLRAMERNGTTFKVNLCLSALPRFRCLPEDRGQYGPTIHLLPDEDVVIAELARGYADAKAGRLPEFPSIEWYVHSAVDPTLSDTEGRHNAALFVEWVPYELAEASWDEREESYVKHLLSICDRFAPGTSDLVVDVFALHPRKIEQHFGITRGHIHHVDNTIGFTDRHPYAYPINGLYSCSAGCHPAGSVIGAAGHNAAKRILRDLGMRRAATPLI
ncbi:MAG TPA: NAD(P)/FAD-dependent oxidoreductase [Polyangiaceae bacterium]|nr:NAD(P)/FAD-dependent oxidoreductase [Polyangiaceae bacterium]